MYTKKYKKSLKYRKVTFKSEIKRLRMLDHWLFGKNNKAIQLTLFIRLK